MAGQDFKFNKFIGRYTSPNSFSRAPEGAFWTLDNVGGYQPGVLEPRRGYSLLTATGSGPLNSLFSFQPKNQNPSALTTILAHSPTTGMFAQYQNGAYGAGVISFGANYFNNYLQPYQNARVRFVAYGYNVYAATSMGVFKTETGNTWFHTFLPQLNTGFGANLAYTGQFGSFYGTQGSSQTMNNPWLVPGNAVAYKFVVIRQNLNDNAVISGPPSDQMIVANTTNVTTGVAMTIQNPLMLLPTDVIQVYRTKSLPINASGAEASVGVDFYLVAELQPVLTNPMSNGYLSPEIVAIPGPGPAQAQTQVFFDTVPDQALYDILYTNPDDGNGGQATTQTPPVAADLCLYKGVMYAGNTQDCHNYTLTIIGTGNTAGQTLVAGQTLTIDGYTYTFITDPNNNYNTGPGSNPNLVPLIFGGVGNGIPVSVFGTGMSTSSATTVGGQIGGPFGSFTITLAGGAGVVGFTIAGITFQTTWATSDAATMGVLAGQVISNLTMDALISFNGAAGSRTAVALTGGGTASANIEYTLKFLETAINMRYSQLISSGAIDMEEALLASYLPGSTVGSVGSLYLTRLVPGNFPFNVSASSNAGFGNNFSSQGAGANGATSDNNTQVANLRFSPLNQPDVFPLENTEVIGSEGIPILRLITTRDGMWIFKDAPDGVFLWSDSGGNTNLAVFDPTVILMAPDACVVMDNDVYALCIDGVQLINQQGKENISLPVQRLLLTHMAYVGPNTLFNVAWAMSYEAEKLVVFALPAAPDSTEASVFYVYNKNTEAWFTYSFRQGNMLHGVMDINTNQVVLAQHQPLSQTFPQSFQLWLERKNYNDQDHQDLPFTLTCPAGIGLSSNIVASPNGPYISAPWTSVVNIGGETGGQLDPTGNNNGYLVTDNATNGLHSFGQVVTGLVTGVTYSYAFYFKPGTYTGGATMLVQSGSQGIGVDASGGVHNPGAGTFNVQVTSAPNGFFLVTFEVISVLTGADSVIIYFGSGGLAVSGYSGTGQGMTIFGASQQGPAMPTSSFLFPSSYHGILPGDLISQAQSGGPTGSLQLVQRCTSLSTTTNFNDTVNLDGAPTGVSWSVGSLLTVQTGIQCGLQLLPVVGPSELVAKTFSDQVRLYFRYLSAEFYSSNVWTDEQPVTDAGQNGIVPPAAPWDTNQPWGSGVWGGAQTGNILSRFTFNRVYARGAELDIALLFANACTRFELESITVGASESMTDRVVRGVTGGAQ